MCGRFTQKSEKKIIKEEFYVQKFLEEPVVNYNVSPSQKAGVILKNENINVYDRYKWGLVPSWAKDSSIGNKMINARSETLLKKPSFKASFINRRCLIPVDGFFEWKKENNNKTPYYIFHKSGRPFALAGLWDEWIDKKDEDSFPLRTFTIVTKDSSGELKEIHDRIPVIIGKDLINLWLDTGRKDIAFIKQLERLIFLDYNDEMDFYKVSQIVNNPANNTPDCIKPIEY